MKIVTREDPTPETVLNLLPGSGGTGTYRGILAVRVAFNATSTSNAATNWINPETGTVVARAFLCLTTAGSGTFDMGVSSNGTGSANTYIDGGTLAVGVQVLWGTAGTVGESKGYVLVGPGGTGTNNSIVMVHSDTVTSTCVGHMVVEYFLLA